jgi:hypothetical protein
VGSSLYFYKCVGGSLVVVCKSEARICSGRVHCGRTIGRVDISVWRCICGTLVSVEGLVQAGSGGFV